MFEVIATFFLKMVYSVPKLYSTFFFYGIRNGGMAPGAPGWGPRFKGPRALMWPLFFGALRALRPSGAPEPEPWGLRTFTQINNPGPLEAPFQDFIPFSLFLNIEIALCHTVKYV